MRKPLLILTLLLLAVSGFAQERLYTEKVHGGAANGIFGKVDGEAEVLPAGQLSYEIPIPAPSGTGGMKPCISVCYNSSTKNGLAGYGFDIHGLSVISRVPSDRFHDGTPTAVNFSNQDHFSMDGQRLASVGYISDTKTEYRTENNIFARILAFGKGTNPTSFKVYTKSGLVYDYLPVSMALNGEASDSTLFWLVTKVSDTNGNYFTVTYGGTACTNDFYPSRIDYTGNDAAGLSPYASLRFEYTYNPYTPITYVNGARVRRSHVLSSIKLCMGDEMVRSFSFDYHIVNRRYQLAKITERVSNGERKNPTIFTWSNITDFSVKKYDYTRTDLIHKATLTVGDFNGDGMADFLVTPENSKAGWKGWKLFISRGTGLELAASGIWESNDDKLEQVVCGDFNGDGYTDIVVKRCSSSKWHNCDLYTTSVDDSGNTSLTYSKCVLSLKTDYAIQPIELNGDGAADLFAWLTDSKECKLLYSTNNGAKITPLGYTATRYCTEKWDRVEFGDFNGDGLTDVMNLNNSGNTIMYSDGAGTMKEQSSSTWPEKRHYMELGDFNGDGKTDLLLTGWTKDPNKDGWSKWCVYYSKGDGHFVKSYREKPFDARTKQLFVADINGDGYDDIQAIDKSSSGDDMTRLQVFLNDGQGNFYQQLKGEAVYATDKWHFYVGDFNGDGKADLVCTSDWSKSNWDGYQLYLMPPAQNCLLTGITDGLGNTTNVKYKYLSDASVFTRGKTIAFSLVSVGSSWPVVASVSVPDGIGGENVTTYQYEDALFHQNGRGLLGFAKYSVKDETTGALTTTEHSVNTDRYVIAPKHIRTTVNGTVIAETEYSYELKTGYASSSCSNSSFTYSPKTVRQRSYEYNTGEQTEDVETEYAYDYYGNPTTTTIKDGDVKTITACTYTNDTENWHLGRLTESTVTKTNANGSVTRNSSFEYDWNSGLLTAETFLPGNTALGYRKTYTHDAFGNIVQSKISPLDNSGERTTETTYDAKGRYVISATNSLGFTATSEYDEALGAVTSSTDANGITTNYAYDKFGSLITAASPISCSLMTTGWSSGMADAPENALYFEWEKTTGKPATIEFYDCLGRLLRKVTESVGGKKAYVDQTYNKRGLVDKVSEPYFAGDEQYWNTSEYDAIGRPIVQTAPDGSRYAFTYDGLKTTTTDPKGNISSKELNFNGLLVESTDNSGTAITYNYDADGKCTETKGPRTTIRCSYDIAGNRTSMTDPDIGSSQDSYNAFGELVNHSDIHGETQYEYDAGGRMTKEVRPDVTISTLYDKSWKGSVDKTVSDGGSYSSAAYTYDEYGRVARKHTVIDDREYETVFTYNSSNQIETITYPEGLKIRNGYDTCGIQTSVSDIGGNKTYWKLKDLDARGQIEKEEYGNGLTTATTHDPQRGTIRTIVTPKVQSWFYSFDAVGNLIIRRDNLRNINELFAYDKLYRLIKVGKNGRTTQTMTYDDAGNITGKSDVGTYVYTDNTNQLSSITDCKRAIAAWDEIRYNSFDKVTDIASNGKTLTICYGPSKSRVLTEMNGTRRYYVDNIFEQKTEDDSVISVNYIFALGKAVAMITQDADGNTNIKYIHHDHLGSIQAYTDGNGKLYHELSYDAWGARRDPITWEIYDVQAAVGVCNNRGFGGHEHIDVFDMVNMDGRIYDPIVGRFISADPLVQAPDLTQSLNRYAYCVNNPLTLVDLSGYSWLSKNWKTITASAVGIAISVVTAGSGSGVGVAIVAGAAGGAAGALTGSLLNGANIGQIAKSTFTGALWGGATGLVKHYIGNIQPFWLRIGAHTLSEGTIEGLRGGNAIHGFIIGGTASLGGSFINNNLESLGKTGEIIANSALSGIVDEIGGGKFANGAITGAFTILFNEMMHNGQQAFSIDNEDESQEYSHIAETLTLAGTALFLDDVTAIGFLDDPIAVGIYTVACGILIKNEFDVIYKHIKNLLYKPMVAEHTKGKRPSTKQKHTDRRSGTTYGKDRNAKRGSKNRKAEHPTNPNKRH